MEPWFHYMAPTCLVQAAEEYEVLSAMVGPPLLCPLLAVYAGVKTKKDTLRRQARARRSDLCEKQGDVGEALARVFFDGSSPAQAGCVAGYWPIRSEPDPRPLMARLAALGWQCALPVVVAPNSPLLFRRWQPGDDLEPGAYDIPEPAPGQPELEPDLLLVPLLAFDLSGHRLGYGAGHYDRTLARLRNRGRGRGHGKAKICAVGLAYAGCECDALPVGEHDEILDMVVTERGIMWPDPKQAAP